uniref:IL-3 receptor alpha chain N-terminal domain-containing protein n=1 Tax=Prolemur simus TaxID=1328070 RepID=A0A8C9B788_PROSS
MVLLVTALLLSELLDPVFLLTPEHLDAPTPEPEPALHVKFDPRNMKLAWDCRENTTSVTCAMVPREGDRAVKKVSRLPRSAPSSARPSANPEKGGDELKAHWGHLETRRVGRAGDPGGAGSWARRVGGLIPWGSSVGQLRAN